jgi:hypothetical protein
MVFPSVAVCGVADMSLTDTSFAPVIVPVDAHSAA